MSGALDRAHGALLGLAIGDALGMPTQMLSRSRVRELWGRIEGFEAAPLASASVAQVHAATLFDGRRVVVKVIRPGIERTIREDIRLLYTLARWLASAPGDGLAPAAVVVLPRVSLNSQCSTSLVSVWVRIATRTPPAK